MSQPIRIGTRDSQLAVWQATLVKNELAKHNIGATLIFIKSEGDIDLVTPLYEIGVQGIFTKTLDAALLANRIDIAVHSMKDVPTQLAKGIVQAAVLKRANYKDILVFKNNADFLNDTQSAATIATSSTRRIAQWLYRYPNHTLQNLRGNVNTRLQKVADNNWDGAVFAAAGLERINVRPENSIDLNWMLPAPAQGAIMVVCRQHDEAIIDACMLLNDELTAMCTKTEKDFLRKLMGGCSTPVGALAEIENEELIFKGNIFSTDGREKVEVERKVPLHLYETIGTEMANELLQNGGKAIVEKIRNA